MKIIETTLIKYIIAHIIYEDHPREIIATCSIISYTARSWASIMPTNQPHTYHRDICSLAPASNVGSYPLNLMMFLSCDQR